VTICRFLVQPPLDALVAHPRLLLLVTITVAALTHHLHPGLSLLVIGAIQLDDVNTITTKDIMPGVADNFFRSGPVTAYMRGRFTRKWVGPQIQENYLFKPMKGGAYKKGAQFDITKRQVASGLLFTPRYYDVNVTEFLEDLEVEQTGPHAMFSRIKLDMSTAALSMSALLEIAFFHHGQSLAGDDRSAELNGAEEALTDGTSATMFGNLFPSYGGQTRVDVAPALNSPTGLVAASAGPSLMFRVLEHSFMSTVIGTERPKLGVTSNRGMGFIAENFSPQQKIDVMDPEINWPGFKFNTATIVASQYAPSQDGVNDPDLGNYLATAAQGEPLIWINPGPQGDDAYIRFYIAQSPKFAFGFTGFKGARDDNMVAGQILFAGNYTFRSPRLSRWLYGFTK